MQFLHLFIVAWIVIASSLVEAKKGNGKKGKKHHDGKKRRQATPLNSLRSSSSGQAFASLSDQRRLGKKGKGGGSDDDDQNLIQDDDDSSNNNNNNNKNDDVEDLDQRFETSMFLLFTGPKKIFNESKSEAIQFLEASIKRAFNLEVSPNSDRFLDSVTLLEQTLVRDTSPPTKRGNNNNNKRHLQKIGRSLKLLNFYTVTGRCRSCRTNAKLLTNDAVKRRRLLEKPLRTLSRRSLQQSSSTTTTSQDTPVKRFEDSLVRILTNQDRFRMFLSITDASISNTIPPNITQVESIIIEPNDDRTSPAGTRPPTASPTSPYDFSWVTAIHITNDDRNDPFQLIGSSKNNTP
jgi:hypothetical protein